MGKAKNKVDVKVMSLEQLQAAAERSSGSQKNKILNEITKRNQQKFFNDLMLALKEVEDGDVIQYERRTPAKEEREQVEAFLELVENAPEGKLTFTPEEIMEQVEYKNECDRVLLSRKK
ncbi:hypothetical protein NVP1101O_048 [Vibrio phage 1.101.O._10N.261.45.C6]|nr:hypothetical protein NVP1101O_048 [Vibrio phage 1.101.O._10N.261.45.C6]